MPALTLRNVSKAYAKQSVLENFNLDINEAEFLVLVGPSGCGKSTLIRSIAGLEEIDKGEINFHNQRIDQLAPKERQLSMVFQNYALYPHKTVYENIAFPLTLGSHENIDTEVRSIASKLGLTEFLQRKPKELSGGQRQRVALARALIKNPEIFLLDEPLSNLDAKLRTQMRSEIHRLHQETGKIFIYVTHDQVEALTLADRIVVLNHGEIQQIGSPEEIYNNPANTFVAGFIGSPPTNLIPLNPETLSKFRNFSPKYPDAILGLRPERLSLESQTGDASLEVTVEGLEMLGSELIVHTYLTGQKDLKITARLPLNDKTRSLLSSNYKDIKLNLHFSLLSPYYFDTIKLSRLGI